MGLNIISKKLLKFNNCFVSQFPERKKEINNLFNSLLELIDAFIYEDTQLNNDRFPFYKNNFKVKSILIIVNDIIRICEKKEVDINNLIRLFYDLDTKLKELTININLARKGLAKILSHLEKQSQ